MQKTEFLTIYATYGNLDIVKQTLPSVIDETRRNNARLIVHDSTEVQDGRDEKWAYLRELEDKHGFFLILSTNLSMAHARNMCLYLGQELYAPDYITMMEDDHGFHTGLISELVSAMRTCYGKTAPSGFHVGLFTGCSVHNERITEYLPGTSHRYTAVKEGQAAYLPGMVNSCFRCAPAHHWFQVLKGYDTDEYLISIFQTKTMNLRNYNKGFCSLLVGDGKLMFHVHAEGRGYSSSSQQKLWDNEYTASDPRSRYLGKLTD